jgi:hypothetical protein
MKKIILAVFIVIFSFFILHSSFALAASPSQEALDQLNAAAGASGANIAGSGPTDPRIIVAIIIRSLLQLIGIVFVVLTVYAGFLWMTAAGEEEKIGKAKKLLSSGAIGLAIILSSYAISYFIFRSLLGATSGAANPFGYGFTSNVTNYGPNPANYEWYTGN